MTETVKEAARRLHVSTRRVRQLLASNALAGRRRGRDWEVFSASVDARIRRLERERER